MKVMSQQILSTMDRRQDHEFAKLKNQALEDAKITEVAKEFESLFIEMMFKEMRKTLDNTSLSGESSHGKDIFNDMLYTEYAKETSKTGGFGLAKMIEDSLRPQPNIKTYE